MRVSALWRGEMPQYIYCTGGELRIRRTGDVLRLVVAQGMRPALIGMLLGLAGAIALRKILESLLYDVGVGDPWTLGGVALLLGLVSAAANAGFRASIRRP